MNKILIVEDEVVISNLIKAEFEANGYKCECAEDRRSCSKLHRK